MPRHARIDFPGLLQHVIARGIEKRHVFHDDQDREDFLDRLEILLRESDTDCYAWALLDNHFHLLLRPKQRPLAEIMRRLLTGYAVVFNHRHDRAGHLFQNRYKSIVCDQNVYLLELIRYIHLNPCRARLVDDLDALANFPWCGHREILGGAPRKLIQSDEVLALFSRKRTSAQQQYTNFLMDGLRGGSAINLSHGGKRSSRAADPSLADDLVYDDRILGGGDFVDHVLSATKRSKDNPEQHLSRLIRRITEYYQIADEKLNTPCKERNLVRAKAVICHIALRKLGMRGVTLASALAYTSTAVSHAAKRGEAILANDKDLERRLEGLLDTVKL